MDFTNSPNMILKIDASVYYLVGVSETDTISNATTWTYNNLDRSWIKKISTYNDSETLKKYKCAGMEGVTIITLNKNKEKVILLNQGLVDKDGKK